MATANMKINDPDEASPSGILSYEACLRKIDASSAKHRLHAARAVYAKMWDASSKNIEKQNGYDWMASLLKPYDPKRILDIGCGSGAGVAALLNQFPSSRVVSLEENPALIAMAKDRLEKGEKIVTVVKRLQDNSTGLRSHQLTFIPGMLRIGTDGGGADLVESDILEDYEFDEFLNTEKKFDAITVWLIGSHLLRYSECDSHRGKINSPDQYRMEIHAVAFALAARFLRSGGILQIVDRGPAPNTKEKTDKLLGFHELITSQLRGAVIVKKLDFLEYNESENYGSIQMVNSSGQPDYSNNLALISVISENVRHE